MIRDELKKNPNFLEERKNDLCAVLQSTVVDILMQKLRKAAKELRINEVAVAGGVSANSALRNAFVEHGEKYGWNVYIPKFSFTTDNARDDCHYRLLQVPDRRILRRFAATFCKSCNRLAVCYFREVSN